MRYGFKILFEKDPSALFRLSDDKQTRVMRALSSLAKYLGMYEEWRRMIKSYGLKWGGDDFSFQAFLSQPFTQLLDECRDLVKVLSERFPHEVHFMALSGLRPSEALVAIKIFHEKAEGYLNGRLMVLEHYRFPEIFIRRTKKAFITVLDEELLEALRSSSPASYNALRCFIRRRRKGVKLNYFRKLYASFMRMEGLLPELIDLLQGRCPNSVFLKSYFRLDMEKSIEEVRGRLQKLRRLLLL